MAAAGGRWKKSKSGKRTFVADRELMRRANNAAARMRQRAAKKLRDNAMAKRAKRAV